MSLPVRTTRCLAATLTGLALAAPAARAEDYEVFASGAGIDDRRAELIDAARALYERVPRAVA